MLIREFLKEKDGLYILLKVLKKEKTWIYLNDDKEVPEEALEILRRVKSGYPVEYIFNEAWFYGERFFVKEGVLIPRDDTEAVLQRALEVIEKVNAKSVIDCCCGSGIIGIEIAKLTGLRVVATDISETALEVAQINAKMHGVDVLFKKCDLLECREILKADVLVSNPPYVENSWKKPNEYEPDIAFYGGDDGLDLVKRLIIQAKGFGFKAAVIEIGYNQKEKLASFLENKVKTYDFFRDLAGNIRGVEILF